MKKHTILMTLGIFLHAGSNLGAKEGYVSNDHNFQNNALTYERKHPQESFIAQNVEWANPIISNDVKEELAYNPKILKEEESKLNANIEKLDGIKKYDQQNIKNYYSKTKDLKICDALNSSQEICEKNGSTWNSHGKGYCDVCSPHHWK